MLAFLPGNLESDRNCWTGLFLGIDSCCMEFSTFAGNE